MQSVSRSSHFQFGPKLATLSDSFWLLDNTRPKAQNSTQTRLSQSRAFYCSLSFSFGPFLSPAGRPQLAGRPESAAHWPATCCSHWASLGPRLTRFAARLLAMQLTVHGSGSALVDTHHSCSQKQNKPRKLFPNTLFSKFTFSQLHSNFSLSLPQTARSSLSGENRAQFTGPVDP